MSFNLLRGSVLYLCFKLLVLSHSRRRRKSLRRESFSAHLVVSQTGYKRSLITLRVRVTSFKHGP